MPSHFRNSAMANAAQPSLHAYLEESITVLRRTIERLPEADMAGAVAAIATALGGNRALLVCGNGGSAADAEHITGELVGRFLKERRALKAICLTGTPAVLTAWANDYSYETVFSRQVEAYGEPGGVLLGLSTSGNSPNVVAAFRAAKECGMTTIALTGEGGGRLNGLADILLAVPSRHTPLIQQAHLCLYHHLCERVEAALTPAA
ncbi:MAG TPA: SIS domain-containing protein [Azospirillaceae bacterium]|nr:SIS domain-containing protein [Azospirillaceae bacterium]